MEHSNLPAPPPPPTHVPALLPVLGEELHSQDVLQGDGAGGVGHLVIRTRAVQRTHIRRLCAWGKTI